MIYLSINGIKTVAECNKRLSAYLNIDSPCGGKGKCGKCKVIAKGELSPLSDREKQWLLPEEISKGVRLACMTEILGNAEIFTLENDGSRIKTDGEQMQYELLPTIKKYGFVVDIGTTTVVIGLYSANGQLLGKTGMLNPQKKWGADVISRIEAVISGNACDLQKAIVETIENALLSLCEKNAVDICEIDGGVITGNTAMLYLATKTLVNGLDRMPFYLNRRFGETVLAKQLQVKHLPLDTPIYLPPCIAPFIGADTVCATLTTAFWERNDTFLMVDIGTNGEMVLFDKGKTYACSTAAGPAFEGAGLSCGMRGENGAIEHVFVKNGEFCFDVIGNKEPKGICGSGVIDAVACFLQTELLDETGYMEADVKLMDNVFFTKKDVRAVQLAKSAIYAGITTLLKTIKVSENQVNSFMVAGGFGGYLNLQNAGEIGLFPRGFVSRTKVLGNAAYNGAVMLLLNKNMREKCELIANNTQVIDLSANPLFLQEYTEGMMF